MSEFVILEGKKKWFYVFINPFGLFMDLLKEPSELIQWTTKGSVNDSYRKSEDKK